MKGLAAPRAPSGSLARVCLGLLLAAGPAVAGATDLLAVSALVRCEGARIATGEMDWRWSLSRESSFGRGRQGRISWAGPDAAVLVVLQGGGPRRLEIRVRAKLPDEELAPIWNGTALEARTLTEQWQHLTWELPAGLVREGPNLLELRSRGWTLGPVAPIPRRISLALDTVTLIPGAECYSAPGAGGASYPEGPADLEASDWLVARSDLPPRAEVRLEAEGSPGSLLRLYAFDAQHRWEVGEVSIPPDGRLRTRMAVGSCCGAESGIALLAAGPEPIRVTELAIGGEDGGLAWRQATGFWQIEWLVLLGGFTLVLVGLRFGWSVPLERWAPWVDLLLLVALSMALRLFFLELFPVPGHAPDGYGYVSKARLLAEGQAELLSEVRWHSWSSWTRPPGFYLLIAGIAGPMSGGAAQLAAAQAWLSGLAVMSVYLTAWLLFGRSAGLAAGLLWALSAESIFTFSRTLSEPLFLFLLLPGLAALAATARRSSWRTAALAGLFLGAAALVRSGPLVYSLLAGGTLVAIHGRRRGIRQALALVACTVAVVVPWVVRSSAIHGRTTGVANIQVANLLQFTPVERFVPHEDLDLAEPQGWDRYYARLKEANRDGELGHRGGAVMRAVLGEKLRHPVATAGQFGRNLRTLFAPYADEWVRWIHPGLRPREWLAMTDLLNFSYLVVLVFGIAGLAMTWRDRRVWPILLWLLLNVGLLCLLIKGMPRYRLQVMPVLMVLAGVALARGLRRLRRQLK